MPDISDTDTGIGPSLILSHDHNTGGTATCPVLTDAVYSGTLDQGKHTTKLLGRQELPYCMLYSFQGCMRKELLLGETH